MLAIGTIDSQARVSCTFASRHQEWKDPCPDTCNHRSTRRNQWLEWNRQEGNGDPWRHDHRTLDRQECCQGEWCHHAYRFNERQGSPRDHQRQNHAPLEIRLRESWRNGWLGSEYTDDNDLVRFVADTDAHNPWPGQLTGGSLFPRTTRIPLLGDTQISRRKATPKDMKGPLGRRALIASGHLHDREGSLVCNSPHRLIDNVREMNLPGS